MRRRQDAKTSCGSLNNYYSENFVSNLNEQALTVQNGQEAPEHEIELWESKERSPGAFSGALASKLKHRPERPGDARTRKRTLENSEKVFNLFLR